jgi:acetoacetate decarboxylase
MSEPWSMPWSAPVFTRPPHSWKGVRSVVMAFQPDPAGLAAVLPPVLEPGEGAGIVTMLSYGWGDGHRTHPFNEAVVLVPVKLDGAEGNFVPFIYVTTDEAMIAGREIAGWPKKLADITWERDGDRFHGSVTRWGSTIIDIEGDFATLPEDDGSMAALMSNGQRPTFNYKLIPGPGEEIEVEEITSSTLDILPSEMAVGRGTMRTDSSEDDPVSALVPGASGPLVTMVSDNTIPLGEVVHRIDHRAVLSPVTP